MERRPGRAWLHAEGRRVRALSFRRRRDLARGGHAAGLRRLLLPLQRARRLHDPDRQRDRSFHQGVCEREPLCAQLRRHRLERPLSQCAAGNFAKAIPAGGRWIELGIYNKYSAPITLTTTDANNINFASGTVSLDDPTPPSLSVTGTIPAFTSADSLALHFAASDPESRAGSVAWNLDGSGGGALVADGCTDVFLCGTSAAADFTVGGLAALADGAHTIHLAAHSAGGDAAQDIHFQTDNTEPAITSGLSVDYDSRTVSLYAQDQTSGIAAATLYADGDAIPTTTTVAVGKPAGTLLVAGVIPAGARLDGAAIDLVAKDSATPANLLDTRGDATRLTIPVRPTPPQLPPASSGPAGSGAASQSAPSVSSVSQDGVTMSVRLSRRLVRFGQRLFLAGRIAVAPGIAMPTRVRILARPIAAPFARRYRVAKIVRVRPDGSFAARIRPILISRLQATALADSSETALATARLGRVNVRARITAIRVTATGVASVTDPTVTARVQPAIPGLRLGWIARLGTTARPICAPADQPVTDTRGRINATCHGSGASPALRYAIRLTPDVQAGLVLLGATSRWVTAATRR